MIRAIGLCIILLLTENFFEHNLQSEIVMNQSSRKLAGNGPRLEDHLNNEKNKGFPKKISIVFFGRKGSHQNKRLGLFPKKIGKQSMLFLDFDEVACAHILLQMNHIQNLFKFQIVETWRVISNISITKGEGDEYRVQWLDVSTGSTQSFTSKDEAYMLQWFEYVVSSKLENDSGCSSGSTDYWIGITSQSIGFNYFYWTEEINDKIVTIITSEHWQKQYSPPSVFEYIAIATFRCSLRSLIRDFIGRFKDHNETRGCIFDYTDDKRYRRISISNPNLCSDCKEIIQKLEDTINKSLDEPISNVLSRKWLGSLKEENSPVYNLRRNYGYNVDVNSGFYKTPWEAFKDRVRENSAQWTVGVAVTIATALIIAYLTGIYHLK
jgi:hypothetical protein